MIRVGFGVTVLARCLESGGVDGIGSYTRELMKRLVAAEGVDLVPISYGYSLPQMDGIEALKKNSGSIS